MTFFGLFFQENILAMYEVKFDLFQASMSIVTFAIDKTNTTSMKACISIQIELTITLSRLRSHKYLVTLL